MTVRIFGVLIGVWLFISNFAWPHTHAESAVTLAGALLAVVFSVLAIFARNARFATAGVGVALFASALLVSTRGSATMWNNAIFGIAIFLAGVLDAGPEGIREERELYGRT
jgi:hypothetical protein